MIISSGEVSRVCSQGEKGGVFLNWHIRGRSSSQASLRLDRGLLADSSFWEGVRIRQKPCRPKGAFSQGAGLSCPQEWKAPRTRSERTPTLRRGRPRASPSPWPTDTPLTVRWRSLSTQVVGGRPLWLCSLEGVGEWGAFPCWGRTETCHTSCCPTRESVGQSCRIPGKSPCPSFDYPAPTPVSQSPTCPTS